MLHIIICTDVYFATSQTTIESEKDGERGGEGEEEGGRREREMAAEVLPVLQALTKAVEKTLSEEQEALGKVNCTNPPI